MDGVDQLNNILIIGMTNRIDMIDEALLRPGRLEVHMEISLPDEKGRYQILNIHTSKMRTNGVMDHDVDLFELASQTKNFSGAEINGLVKSATSFAFNRHVKVGTMAGISDDVENLRVNRQDFQMALGEVHPAFGVSEEELEQVIQNGIIHYDSVVEVSTTPVFVERIVLTGGVGNSQNWETICGASANLDENATCQHSPPWAFGFREDRAGGVHCARLGVPLYQAHFTRLYAWVHRVPED